MNYKRAVNAFGLVLLLAVAACNSSDDFDEPTSFEDLAGVYERPEPPVQASATATEPEYGVLNAYLTKSGFFMLRAQVPRVQDADNYYPGPLLPVYLNVFGRIELDSVSSADSSRLSGTLNQQTLNGVGAPGTLYPEPAEFARIDMQAYSDGAMAGLVTLADGSELVVDLQWAEALQEQAGLQEVQGIWSTSFLNSWWDPDGDTVRLELDDVGSGFGSLNDECALTISLQPVLQDDLRTLDANSDTGEAIVVGDVFVMEAVVNVSGCQDAADYVGELVLLKWDPVADAPLRPYPYSAGDQIDILLGNENGLVRWTLLPGENLFNPVVQ